MQSSDMRPLPPTQGAQLLPATARVRPTWLPPHMRASPYPDTRLPCPSAAAPRRLPCPVTPPCSCPFPLSQAGSARAARLQGPALAAGHVAAGLRRRGGTGRGVKGVCVGIAQS